MALNKKTYLGEFCAHEDEENQSQELARRLHLLPPVCVDQRSHMQIESLRVPPQQQSSPPRLLLGFFFFLRCNFFIIIITINNNNNTNWSLSSPAAAERSVSRNRLCAYSVHIGCLYLFGSLSPPSLRGRTYLSLRQTDAEHWAKKDAQSPVVCARL